VRRRSSVFGGAGGDTYAFSVSGGGRLRRSAVLTLPLSEPASPGATIAVAYQGTGGVWYAAAGTASSTGTTVRARVKHLSTWAGVDVDAYLAAQIDQATAAARVQAAAANCARTDPTVTIAGTSPLEACVDEPDSRNDERLVLNNPTDTSYVVSNCTGGLPSGCPTLTLGVYTGVIDGGNFASFRYDATVPHSTLTFAPSGGATVALQYVPKVLGKVFGAGVGLIASVGSCINKHNPASLSLVAGIAQGVECILAEDVSVLKIGILNIGGLTRDVLQALIGRALNSFASSHPMAAGGTLTLDAAQTLPDAGGSPPSSPPPSNPQGDPPPPAPNSYRYVVKGTCYDQHCGLRERTGPGYTAYDAVGTLYDGDPVDVVCQAQGELVGPGRNGQSSAIWDRLTNGYWVADYYISTPNVGTFSPPIPQC
jgi:hypothetical protein